jgi:hypothetical protein
LRQKCNESANGQLHAGVDSRLLLFALAVSVAAGILSGLAPGWQAHRQSLVMSLRERGGSAFGGIRIRKMIVIAGSRWFGPSAAW